MVAGEATSFACISDADFEGGIGGPCHESGSQQSLEIEHGIVVSFAECLHDAGDCQHTAESGGVLKLDDFPIDGGAASHDIRETGFDDPGDFCGRQLIADGLCDRQRADDIAE